MFENIYSGRRVLVTGHTGFKGSWLCQWLSQLGAEVAGFSINVPSQPSNFEVLKLGVCMQDFRGDVRNLDELLRVFDKFQPDMAFHLAAQPLVRTSYDEPKLTFDTNLGGTVNFLEAVHRTSSIKAGVVVTSDKCYENVEWEYGYRETDHLGGKDPYSASKACAEIAFNAYWCSFFAVSEKRLATVRAGNVIGGGDWAENRIVPDCVRAWTNGQASFIRNPRATRPWQHVLEPLSGYLWLGAELIKEHSGLAGEAFNFGPNAEIKQPVSKLIEEMLKIWPTGSWDPQLQSGAEKLEAGLLKLCCDKALHRLDWQAILSFEETVRMTAEWYQQYYAGVRDMAAFTKMQIRFYEDLAKERSVRWAMS